MDHPLYDSDFDIRKKGKTLDIIKSDCQCGGGERKKTQRKEHRLGGGSEDILYDTRMVDTGHYSFLQTHRMSNGKSER